MAEYKYTATNPEGVIVSETILAENEEEVELMLKRQSLLLVNLRLLPDAEEKFFDKLLHKVTNTDKAQFLEYFASMLEAGLTVSDVLQAFYEDLDKPLLRKFVKDTQYGLRNGKRLSECFEAYPELFPQLYVGMIKVGEASGTLAESLRHLADQLKKSNELRSKVKNAMIYPSILVTAMVLVIIILLLVVFPRMQEFFGNANMELPALTMALISISKLAQQFWLPILLGIIVLAYAFRKGSSNPDFRRWQGKMSLRIPVLGPLNRAVNVATLTRTFGSLLSSGVNILESVEVVKASMTNQVYRDILDTVRNDLEVGNTLADSLKKFPEYFSPFEIRVLSISERTGEVADGLKSIAEFYETKVHGLLSGLSSAIEPLIMIVMGGVVAVIAVSVITPIYQLLSGVSNIGQ